MCRLQNIALESVTEKCDRRTDGRTDDGQSDPYVSLCFAGDTKMKFSTRLIILYPLYLKSLQLLWIHKEVCCGLLYICVYLFSCIELNDTFAEFRILGYNIFFIIHTENCNFMGSEYLDKTLNKNYKNWYPMNIKQLTVSI